MPSLLGDDPRVIPNKRNTTIPTGQGLLDAAALLTTPVPVLGDITGLFADANMMRNEGVTPGNLAMAGLGLLPFVPGAAMLRSADDALGASPSIRNASVGDKTIPGSIYGAGTTYNELLDLVRDDFVTYWKRNQPNGGPMSNMRARAWLSSRGFNRPTREAADNLIEAANEKGLFE